MSALMRGIEIFTSRDAGAKSGSPMWWRSLLFITFYCEIMTFNIPA